MFRLFSKVFKQSPRSVNNSRTQHLEDIFGFFGTLTSLKHPLEGAHRKFTKSSTCFKTSLKLKISHWTAKASICKPILMTFGMPFSITFPDRPTLIICNTSNANFFYYIRPLSLEPRNINAFNIFPYVPWHHLPCPW